MRRDIADNVAELVREQLRAAIDDAAKAQAKKAKAEAKKAKAKRIS